MPLESFRDFLVLKFQFIKEKVEHSQTERVKNTSYKFKKLRLCYGPLILAGLSCYCGDNGYKMWNSFETLFSKNTAKCLFYQNSG